MSVKKALAINCVQLTMVAVLGAGLMGCATTEESVPPKNEPPPQKIFRYPLEVVWRASQLSLRYPLQTNNIESGIIETEWIRAADGFRPPHLMKTPSTGLRYKVRLVFEKGFSEGKPAIKVTASKRQERLVDFFTEPQPVPSDRIEEGVLLYRIERELKIEDGIRRSVKKQAEQSAAEPNTKGKPRGSRR